MKTPIRRLSPLQAWEEATRRSIAIGVAGWAVVGALQAAGAIPPLQRPWLAPALGLVSAFLAALTLSLAQYHRRCGLGVFGTALGVLLPLRSASCGCGSGLSPMSPLVSVPLVEVVVLWEVHRRISGPRLKAEEDAQATFIEEAIGHSRSKPTWVDRVTLLCIVVSVVLLLILLSR
jgi:hypothetical protein